MKNINPTKTKAWSSLEKIFIEEKQKSITQMFLQDKNRVKKFSINWKSLFVDYSKNIISERALKLLFNLAEELDLADGIVKQFSGEVINKTEVRAVLHTALRSSLKGDIKVKGVSISKEINDTKQRLKVFSEAVINGSKRVIQAKHLQILLILVLEALT